MWHSKRAPSPLFLIALDLWNSCFLKLYHAAIYTCVLYKLLKKKKKKSFLCIEAGALHCLRLDPSSRNKKINK